MRRTTIFWAIIVILALVTSMAAVIRTTGLPRAFRTRKAEVPAVPRDKQELLTEAGIAHLPPPVHRYVARTGSVGRPVVTEIVLEFDATMNDAPGAAEMSGPVVQFARWQSRARSRFCWPKVSAQLCGVIRAQRRVSLPAAGITFMLTTRPAFWKPCSATSEI
jgi:hypothetical protein